MAKQEYTPDRPADFALLPSIVSWHELANRLAVVETLVRLIAASTPEELRQGHLDRLKQQVYTLRSAAEELSELATGALADKWEILDVARLLAQVCESLLVEAQMGGVALDYPDDRFSTTHYPPLIRGNRQLLRPALLNIVRNAIQFSPPGSKVKARLRATRHWVHVQILDEGPGLPPAFTPVAQQLGESTRPGGHGIGLYITALVLERWHDGRLRLFNRKPHGSIAYIRLPRRFTLE
ncbi:MAG: HAMP domain-containing histidine kinase [Limnochordales bacterium]|nr:HAMP domain-containing histidine kinase [Limnochordales bacterium]